MILAMTTKPEVRLHTPKIDLLRHRTDA